MLNDQNQMNPKYPKIKFFSNVKQLVLIISLALVISNVSSERVEILMSNVTTQKVTQNFLK